MNFWMWSFCCFLFLLVLFDVFYRIEKGSSMYFFLFLKYFKDLCISLYGNAHVHVGAHRSQERTVNSLGI